MAYKNFKLTEFIEEIGTELRTIRTAKKLTINNVANNLSSSELSLSATMLGRIETGERRIDDELFLSLCQYYGADPYNLIKRAAQNHIDALKTPSEQPGESENASAILTPEELYRLYSNINNEGKKEIGTLLRMMAYMNAFKK